MMFVMRTFLRLGLLLGYVLLMPGFLLAQAGEETAIIILFEKEGQFTKFQSREIIEKEFGWIEREFDVTLIKHSKANEKLTRKVVSERSIDTLKMAFNPKCLLIIRPLSASEKILSGEIECHDFRMKKGFPLLRSKPFGADKDDLAQTISRKIKELFKELKLPPKRRILGIPAKNFAQGVIVVGTIVWMIVADNDTLKALPAPKSLPDKP